MEASLDVPSGHLEVHECTGGPVDVIPVSPGFHRIRAHFAGLDTLGDDGLQGDDRYELVVWPAPIAAISVPNRHPHPGETA